MTGPIVSAREAADVLPKLLSRIGDAGTYYITDGRGRARAVLLDVDRYHAMMDALEEQSSGNPDASLANALIREILSRAKK